MFGPIGFSCWVPLAMPEGHAEEPHQSGAFMSSQLSRARNRAFFAQDRLCYYCEQPIWLTDVEAFARFHGIPVRRARSHQATAEHLKARQHGGGGGANIVAACRHCNTLRHRGRPDRAPTPEARQHRVRQLIRAGRWNRVLKPLDVSQPAGRSGGHPIGRRRKRK